MDINKMYDDIAEWYDLLFQTTSKYDYIFVDYLDLDIFKKHSVRTVLDCACGTGNQSIGLIRLGYDVTSSDLNYKMLQKAKAKAKRYYNVKLNTIHAGWSELINTFGSGIFDAVLCAGNSFYHSSSNQVKLNYLRQMCTVLKKNGICFIDYERWDDNFCEIGRDYFRFYHHSIYDGKNYLFWSTYKHKGRLQDLTIYIMYEDKGATNIIKQRVPGYAFTFEEISKLAMKAGFSTIQSVQRPGIWDLNAILCIK